MNFKGYDISPDMVRLSLVNMYLHGFAAPHIFEYDTLTSEERWNEYADVILANPPFMSPKGGIRPHNRFSVKSKRSEVLFVDYMAEHLMPSGRAGIIVPEGIIFQSQTAYKHLRKMLVEEYLVAVVSLPAGVFNPYSGVKTSILILDKSLAKQAGTIAFFKIESDGFGLGAQRRKIDKDDLPKAHAEIAEYLRRLRAGEALGDFETTQGLIVEKGKLAANEDYNLSGERYREGVVQSKHFPWRTVESLVETITPPFKIQKAAFGSSGRFPIIDQSQDAIAGWTDDESTLVHPTQPLVIFGDHTCALKLIDTPFAQGADGIKILQTVEALDPRFLFRVLRARPLESSGYQRHYSKLKEHQIPLPPLEVQEEIVAEIEGYQKVIDGARAVIDNYRTHIAIDPEWPMVELGEVCERLQYGLSARLNTEEIGYKTFRMNELIDGRCVDSGNMKCVDISAREFAKYRLVPGDILFNRTNSFEHVGRTGIFDLDGDYCFASYLIRLSVFEDAANMFYVNDFMNTESFRAGIKQYATRAIGQSNINAKSLAAYRIPIPPLSTQNRIVAEIEAEQALVNANHELIARFEKKIQDTLARVWGNAEPDTAEA